MDTDQFVNDIIALKTSCQFINFNANDLVKKYPKTKFLQVYVIRFGNQMATKKILLLDLNLLNTIEIIEKCFRAGMPTLRGSLLVPENEDVTNCFIGTLKAAKEIHEEYNLS